jgi:uncharacterized RDD family membrane protein YckC
MAADGSTWLGRGEQDKKLARQIVTPEGVPLELVLASAGDRAVAFVLDMVIQIVVTIGVAVGLAFATGNSESSWLAPFVILFVFVLLNFYFAFFELRWQGATPGKRKIGLRVIDARGGQLTSSAVLARNFARELEVWTPLRFLLAGSATGDTTPGWVSLLAGAWTFVFMLMPLFNKDKLRVGDLIAGTRVVRAPDTVLLPDLVAEAAPVGAKPAAAHTFTDAQLAVYGIYELQVLEDLLRKPPGTAGRETAIATVTGTIKQKIGYRAPTPDEERFLREFYAAQRAHLEQKMLFGQRREDKFARK